MRWWISFKLTMLRYQYRDGPLENSDIIDKTVKHGYFVDVVVDTSIGMDRMSGMSLTEVWILRDEMADFIKIPVSG